MYLCWYAPELLDRDLWFVAELLRQAPLRDVHRQSALDHYRARCEDLSTIGYARLLEADAGVETLSSTSIDQSDHKSSAGDDNHP